MLINRPQIHENESISSYLYRVAMANYISIGCVIAPFKIRKAEWLANIYSDSQLSQLSSQFTISVEELYRGTYQIYENVLSKHFELYLLKNRIKFCPDCSREQRYHRTLWGLKPVTICLKHFSRLIDRCSKCGRPVALDQYLSGYCKHCGNRYDQTKTIIIPRDSIEYCFQNDFYGALIHNTKMLKSIGGLTAPQFLLLARISFYLLEGLKSFLDLKEPVIRIFHNRYGGVQNNDLQAQSYNHAYWMYQDFPNHFKKVLSHFIQKPKKAIYEQKKVFEEIFQLEGFDIVKSEYEQFWISELDKGTVRRDLSVFKDNPNLLSQKKYLRKEEVKRITGISYPKIESLDDIGYINITTLQNGGTKQHFIDKVLFDTLHEEKQRYVNKTKAAQVLGIQRNSVFQLIKEGFLKEVRTPFSPYKLILLHEVLELLYASRGDLNLNVKGVMFHQALIKFSVNGLTISRLLRFIHQKDLKPNLSVLDGNLSDIWFMERELHQCMITLKLEKQEEEGMYMGDVIKYLKIGEIKMKRYMENGSIIPDKVVIWKDGRKRYKFKMSKVEQFKIELSLRK